MPAPAHPMEVLTPHARAVAIEVDADLVASATPRAPALQRCSFHRTKRTRRPARGGPGSDHGHENFRIAPFPMSEAYTLPLPSTAMPEGLQKNGSPQPVINAPVDVKLWMFSLA
jgi:hypothetical protein